MAERNRQTGGSRIERLRDVIRWRLSVAFGVGAWLIGLAVTFAVLLGFGVTDRARESGLTLTAWALFEGIGGIVNPDIGTAPAVADRYLLLDSELLAPGIIIHMLVPAVLFVLVGYLLADRHARHSSAITPAEAALGGTTFVLVFAPLSVIGTLVLGGSDASIGVAQAVVVSVLYPAVFGAVGAASRVRIALSSLWGFLGGIAAFLVGLAAWGVLTKPLADWPGRDSLSDFEGLEYFEFAQGFVDTHVIGGGEVIPGWYVVVVPLVLGAVIAYRERAADPLVGSGRGARLGLGYVLPVAVVVIGAVLAQVRDISESVEGAWADEQVETANALIGVAPRPILLGGVVFPVVFAAVGGAVGAAGYAVRHPDARESDDEREQPVQRQRQPRSQHQPEQHQRRQQEQKERRQQQSSEQPRRRQPQQQRPQNRDRQAESDRRHEETERRRGAQSEAGHGQPNGRQESRETGHESNARDGERESTESDSTDEKGETDGE